MPVTMPARQDQVSVQLRFLLRNALYTRGPVRPSTRAGLLIPAVRLHKTAARTEAATAETAQRHPTAGQAAVAHLLRKAVPAALPDHLTAQEADLVLPEVQVQAHLHLPTVRVLHHTAPEAEGKRVHYV